ncbi:MAG: XdhC family protein [Acidimicrobiia bacterium]|nr:XdhC family protein [Acidimicrobiia bacterium]
MIEAVQRLVTEERLGALVTMVEGPDVGAKAVIDYESGLVAGELPAGIADEVLADARVLMEHEHNRTLQYGERAVFIETVAPPPHLVVFGAVHIAQPLSTMARQLGFRVTVSDARPAFTTAERFPDADRVLVGWPDDLTDDITLDGRTYVVLLSHDARFEDPVLPWVLDSPVKYIGAMGSRKTSAKRVEKLLALGYSDDQVARIHGPVGLDIGGETPAETAVAILAEIIQVRYGAGTGESLRGTTSPIHASRGDGGKA